jgi:hypothetical protein
MRNLPSHATVRPLEKGNHVSSVIGIWISNDPQFPVDSRHHNPIRFQLLDQLDSSPIPFDTALLGLLMTPYQLSFR